MQYIDYPWNRKITEIDHRSYQSKGETEAKVINAALDIGVNSHEKQKKTSLNKTLLLNKPPVSSGWQM